MTFARCGLPERQGLVDAAGLHQRRAWRAQEDGRGTLRGFWRFSGSHRQGLRKEGEDRLESPLRSRAVGPGGHQGPGGAGPVPEGAIFAGRTPAPEAERGASALHGDR